MSRNGGFSVKRTVSAAAVVALAASGLIAGAAQAADSDLHYGNIDPNQPRTVRIHKFESGSLAAPVTERKNDGQGDGVVGVPFKLYPINVDLLTAEGWETISKHQNVPSDACTVDGGADWTKFQGPSPLEAKLNVPAVEIITEDGGVATAENIALGAYLVCEQPAPNATKEDKATKVSVVRKSAPFIVTVPRPQTDGNAAHTGWIYDVNAYPKNTVVEAPKKTSQILKNGAKNTDGIRYFISSVVPRLQNLPGDPKDQNFKYFSIMDQMPSNLTDAHVVSVQIGEVGHPVGAEVPTANWEVDESKLATHSFLAVNFTSEGLTYLKGKPNATIVVTIDAKVNSFDNNAIENNAYLAVDAGEGTVPGVNPPTPLNSNGPGQPPTYPGQAPGTPVPSGKPDIKVSNKSASTWGDIKIKKQDAAQITEGLEGAEFQVFEASDQRGCVAAAGNAGFGKFNDQTVTHAKVGNPIAVKGDGNSTFTTTKDGDLVIEGLFIDKVDGPTPGATVTPKTTKCYVVQESRQPAGYVLPADVDRTFAVIVKAGVSTQADLTVTNTKVTVPALPLTGASGRVLLMVGGLALVLGSMGFVMVLRKRNAEA